MKYVCDGGTAFVMYPWQQRFGATALFTVNMGFAYLGYRTIRYNRKFARAVAVKRGSPWYFVSSLFLSTEDDMAYLRVRTVLSGLTALVIALALCWFGIVASTRCHPV